MRARLALALAIALLMAPASAGAAARLDRSFGDGGYATMSVRGATALAYDAIITGRGKVVVAGQSVPSRGTPQVLVARYRSDGRLDRGFGEKGVFESSFPTNAGPFLATALARESGGKLLVGGGYGEGSMLLMRLRSDGRLDPKFGRKGRGYATAAAGGVAQSILPLDGGGALLGGSDQNVNGRPMNVASFTAEGALDRSYGDAGVAETIFWDPTLASSAGVLGLVPAPGGGVTGFGHLDYIGSDGHGSAGVFQLGSDGTPVPGFGDAGHVEVAFTRADGGFDQWFPCGFGADGQGRITIAGDGSVGSQDGLLAARVTPEGTLDPTFGSAADGRAALPGLAQDSDTTCGATVASSGALTAGVGDALARLGADGAPDGTFATGGLLHIAKPKRVSVNAVAAAGSDRIVVAGSAGNDLYVARYRVPAS